MDKKKKIKIAAIITSVLVALIIIIATVTTVTLKKKKKPISPQQREVSERGFPIYKKEKKETVENADFYVSIKDGDDANDGSKSKPFKTLNKAQQTIRHLIKNNPSAVDKDIVVAVKGGEYNLKQQFSFNKQDNLPNGHRLTYTSYNTEEVKVSGGIHLKVSEFKSLSEEDSARIEEKAKGNVKVINLLEKGLTEGQIGKLYSIGGYTQGKKYGEDNGATIEVFYEGNRMDIAKYPNEGFSKIGTIVDYGEAEEHVPDIINWAATPNPRPPKFKVGEDVKNCMQRWKKPTSEKNAIWAYGYFYWDWADVSSPITDFSKTEGQLDLKYSSTYGIKEGAKYCVYNILEELDQQGEYYIDREKGNLYVFIPNGYNEEDNITLSILDKDIIQMREANNITLDGITVECGKRRAIDAIGNNIKLKNLLVKNVREDGIRIEGQDNLVSDCEVMKVGKSGIIAGKGLNYKEGNIENDIRMNGLRKENNEIKNNYIHAYGEIYKSGVAGVNLRGVGNRVAHNEIFDSPYAAILYVGNEHLIEYNHIHEVVKKSSDMGAIYSGRNLSFFGNILRYNAIRDIGGEEFTPNGIYFDDCLAGQVAYGNVLVNIPGNGFLIGGGRDHKVFDNVIINAKTSIRYDARAYDGLSGGWYKKNVETPTARQWNLLKDAQALYNNWLKDKESVDIIRKSEADYSRIAKMLGFDDREKPDSAATPNGDVFENIIVSTEKEFKHISETTKKYANIRDNKIYDIEDEKIKNSFANYSKGNYKIKKGSIIAKENENYDRIPYHLIGRCND